jgi:hypothetical protein
MPQTLSLAFALYRSRYLGAVFHSPVTTLSRHFGVNAPVLHLRFPRRTPSRIRSISGSFTPSGFEADPGRYRRPTPVSRADFRRSRVFRPPPLPFGHFRTLRIKAFSEHPTREARLTELRSPFAPRCDFFRFRSGSTLPVRCVPLD